jgi:ferredoxin
MGLKDNATCEYYVGPECAGCGLCLEIAPRNFSMNEVEGQSYVSSQPANDFEEAQCREAMLWCPTDSICDDGLEKRPGPYTEKMPLRVAVQ